MEFYDVREGVKIFSSHRTLRQASLVQQKEPGARRVVLTSLNGTKWQDLQEYSTAQCRKAVTDGKARRSRP